MRFERASALQEQSTAYRWGAPAPVRFEGVVGGEDGLFGRGFVGRLDVSDDFSCGWVVDCESVGRFFTGVLVG